MENEDEGTEKRMRKRLAGESRGRERMEGDGRR